LILVPLGNKAFLARYKINNVVEMDWWDQYDFKSAKITFLPSRHWSARWLNDKFITLWGSFGIEIENRKIYFAGDTGFSLKNFTNIHSRWGAPDVAILPIGAYEPEWFMQQNHMNPKEAVQAHRLLQAKHSIPIHYGTFQLSDEGINEPLVDLEKALSELQINSQKFHPLLEGASRNF
jgi:N-acyl-phosphatidylethanolamine-hydrolysing phospholipase D